MKTLRSLFLLGAFALLSGSVFAQARYTIIHTFAGGANDGANPQGDLIISDTTLYGMTGGGGRDAQGTVFKCNTDGTGFQILHHFSLDSTDGRFPFGSLILSGTALYGMTGAGGSNDLGTIFKINTDGTGFAILHSFAGGDADGAHPYGSLTLSGTTLYGMTYGGGSATVDLHWQTPDGVEATVRSADQGTVFRIDTDGTGFALLHSFSGATWVNLEPPDHSPEYGYASQDGAYPYGSLILSGSTLYGMTSAGGGGNQNMSPGTIFSINTDGTGYAVLHPLQGCVNPLGPLTQFGSTLYGTTRGYADVSLFGVGSAIIRIDTDGTNLATLYAPTVPLEILQGSLIRAGSIFYGRTSGATADSVFQINADGTGYAVLQSLPARPTANPGYYSMEWLSQCSLTLSGSTLSGMTSSSGAHGAGMIFSLVLNAAWITAQPFSQTVAIGADATFSVVASGPPPLAYQWQRAPAGSNVWADLSDGTAYSGTSTATLTVNSATAAMNGDLFRCVSTNSYGYDTSSVAVLVVPTPLTVSTVAGQGGHSGGSDGSGSAAQFYGPTDVAVDSAGNVYVTDTNNHTIRKVSPTGAVSTVAGYPGASGNSDGTATTARFNRPSGVTVDGTGNIYVADTNNNTVRRITTAGVVSTLAGAAGMSGSADGTGTAARFNGPSGIVSDSGGILYVADTLNHTIRRITASGMVSTLAGAAGISGSTSGVGTAARFFGPQGLALGSADTLWVADTNNSIIRQVVISNGSATTWAGLAGASGSADGPSSMARFAYPSGVAFGGGNLYVADTDNHTVRVITLVEQGEVTTIAGKAGTAGSADGVGDAARFNHPTGIAIDRAGNIYVADTDNDTIRVGYFAAAPTITVQPQSQTVTLRSSVQFSVTASGQPAPTYQWNFNGNAINGATGSSLSLTNVQAASAGDYTVTVSNSSGSVTSNKATLTVNAPAPPPSGGGGGGGGGVTEPWFAAALVLLQCARWMRQRDPEG